MQIDLNQGLFHNGSIRDDGGVKNVVVNNISLNLDYTLSVKNKFQFMDGIKFVCLYIKPIIRSLGASSLIFATYIYVSNNCSSVICKFIDQLFLPIKFLSALIVLFLSIPIIFYNNIIQDPLVSHIGWRIPNVIFYLSLFIAIFLAIKFLVAVFKRISSK